MKEIVLVTQVKENDILARHCSPISEKASSSRRFWKVKEREFPLENPENFPVSSGDYVEIEQSPGHVVRTAFTLFILPLVMFLAVYLLSSALAPSIQVVLSITAMAIGFLTPFLLRKLGKKDVLPHIVRVLQAEKAKEALACNVGCQGCKGCG